MATINTTFLSANRLLKKYLAQSIQQQSAINAGGSWTTTTVPVGGVNANGGNGAGGSGGISGSIIAGYSNKITYRGIPVVSEDEASTTVGEDRPKDKDMSYAISTYNFTAPSDFYVDTIMFFPNVNTMNWGVRAFNKNKTDCIELPDADSSTLSNIICSNNSLYVYAGNTLGGTVCSGKATFSTIVSSPPSYSPTFKIKWESGYKNLLSKVIINKQEEVFDLKKNAVFQLLHILKSK